MLLHKRRILEVLIDFAIICGAYVGAHLLRFEGDLVESQHRLLMRSLPIVMGLQIASLALVRLYQGVWRHVSIPDILTIFKGVSLGAERFGRRLLLALRGIFPRGLHHRLAASFLRRLRFARGRAPLQ
jgi:FlaA1/EpsC-like NDP-sugar epimerase